MSNETIWPAYAEQQTTAPRRSSGLLADLAWVVGYFVVAGLVAAVVWWQVVTPASYTRTADNAVMLQVQLGHRVGADGWFVVIGLVGGLVGGVLLTTWRGRNPLAVVVVGYLASLGAGILALTVGKVLGHHDVAALAKVTRVGGTVPDSLDVISHLVVAAWPLGFLIASLVLLFGTRASRHDVEPGTNRP